MFSTLAVQGALPELVAHYQAASGGTVEVVFAPTNAILERIAAGEAGDVAIVTRSALDDLALRDVIDGDTVADIAISRVGIAVRAGAWRYDISSIEALKMTLIEARSIAYSRIGASGVFFAQLIQSLDIADVVNAKAVVTAGGLTAEVVARGEADLAVQQVSELMLVPGIDVIGPLPPGAESVTLFSAGIFAGKPHAAGARELLTFLRSPAAAAALAATGLQPAA